MKNLNSLDEPRKHWSKERIILLIRTRYDNGWALNPQALAQEDASLLAAGRRYFGNWNCALRAAEVPEANGRAGCKRHDRGYWTRERIIEEIRRSAQSGHSLHAHAMQKMNNRLVSAATYYFGSWAEALSQAGFDANNIRAVQRHSYDSVMAAIRRLAEENADLRDSAIRRTHRPLYWAAQKYCGGWRNAVASALHVSSDSISS